VNPGTGPGYSPPEPLCQTRRGRPYLLGALAGGWSGVAGMVFGFMGLSIGAATGVTFTTGPWSVCSV